MQGILRRLGGANNSSEMQMQSAFAQEFLCIKILNSLNLMVPIYYWASKKTPDIQ